MAKFTCELFDLWNLTDKVPEDNDYDEDGNDLLNLKLSNKFNSWLKDKYPELKIKSLNSSGEDNFGPEFEYSYPIKTNADWDLMKKIFFDVSHANFWCANGKSMADETPVDKINDEVADHEDEILN